MKQYRKLLVILGVIFSFFLLSFVFNRFPQNSLIAGGDFYQLYSNNDQLSRYAYAWFNQVGQGIPNPLFATFPYYLLLSGLDIFLASGLISSSILFGFILSSFFSFYYSVGYLLSKISFEKKIFSSLIYALNPFVITVFTYPWGFTHHFLIYIFLPLLFANFYVVLTKEKPKTKDFIIFSIINFIATPAYGNIAFFVLVLLIYGVTFLNHLLLFGRHKYIQAFKRFFALLGILSIVITPIFIPVVSTVFSTHAKSFGSQEALGGDNYLYNWIKSTSNSPLNVLNLALDSYRYPYVSPGLSFIAISINSSYFILFLGLLYIHRDQLSLRRSNAQFLIFFSNFIVFFILSLRYFGPFELINRIIYESPFFIFFRSSDKIFVALVFFYTVVLSALIYKIDLKKYKFYFFLYISILFLPFFIGTISHTLANSYNLFAKKIRPEYTYIVSVPQEYINLSEKLNLENKQTAILSLPYSVKNSLNWANYPKWNFVGHDILHILFKQRYISANSFDYPSGENKLSFKEAMENGTTDSDLLKSIHKFGTEYIIYHHDIDPGLYNKNSNTLNSINSLTTRGELSLKETTDFYSLYSVNDEKIRPLFSFDSTGVLFKKINPTLYILEVEPNSESTLTFLQSFDPRWKIGVIPNSSQICTSDTISYKKYKTTECIFEKETFFHSYYFIAQLNQLDTTNHSLCYDFANCWTIDTTDLANKKLVVYYSGQNYVYLLILYLTIATITTLTLVYVKYIKK